MSENDRRMGFVVKLFVVGLLVAPGLGFGRACVWAWSNSGMLEVVVCGGLCVGLLVGAWKAMGDY